MRSCPNFDRELASSHSLIRDDRPHLVPVFHCGSSSSELGLPD